VFEVIDTIDLGGKSSERFPDWSLGEGVLAILEPDGPRPRKGLAGKVLMLRRPDGTSSQLVADAVKFGGVAFLPCCSRTQLPTRLGHVPRIGVPGSGRRSMGSP
jgi:hypothetical protein